MPTRGHNLRMPTHPLLQALYVLLGGVVLIGALFMGAILLSVALGIGLIVGFVAFLRASWQGRGRPRQSRQPGQARRTGSGRAGGELLEAEYTVVEERDERDDQGR